MAELDNKPDFGIENTMSIDTAGAGDANLLNDLFATETSTADPNDLTAITDDDDDNKDGKGPDGKADPTKLAGQDDNVPDSIAKDPNALTNFLLGDGEEEEEVDADDDKDDKDKAAPDAVADPPPGDGDDAPDAADKDDATNDGIIAFDALANELVDLGVFTRQEGEEEGVNVTTPEEFLERFKKETELGAQDMVSNFIGQFGKEHQEAFQAIYVNGANPREFFSQQAKISDFTNMDLTVEGNQEKVVRQTLADQGFEPEDITSEIDKLKSYGDLEDVSKRHHKVLIKKEKQLLKQTQMDAQQATIQKQAQKDEYVTNVRDVLSEKLKAKEFDGIPLNPKIANELQDFLLVDKWKTESGETLTDFDKNILDLKRPENHANKVKIALLLKLLENDPTLSTIQKRGVSTKSSELFKSVARQKTVTKRVAADKKQPAQSWFQK